MSVETKSSKQTQTNNHNTQNLITPQNIADAVSGFLYWKDIDSVYLGCNKKFLSIADLPSTEAIIGISDYAIHWKKQAKLFQHEDHKARVKNNIININTTLILDDKEVDFLVTKSRLYDDQGKITGMVGHATIIERKILSDELSLEQNFGNPLNNKQLKTFRFQDQNQEIILTPREQECLQYVVVGYSIKHMADIMCISKRTAETHLENIKHKFNCSSKSQLIFKAFKIGFVATLYQDSRL